MPQIQKEIVEGIPLVPLERIHERIVELTVDLFVSHTKEKIAEVVPIVSQAHLGECCRTGCRRANARGFVRERRVEHDVELQCWSMQMLVFDM